MLREDPLPVFQQSLKQLVEAAGRDGVLSKREKLFLLPPQCSHPYLYHLPKIHKSTVSTHGRPIVAGTNGFISGLSQYIDNFLQPIVVQLPSFIRDSGHVISTLCNYRWDSNYKWASLEVSLLCIVSHMSIDFYSSQQFL